MTRDGACDRGSILSILPRGVPKGRNFRSPSARSTGGWLRIGGEQTPIALVGLTPGLVGLYKVNFQVPADAPDDSLAVLVSQGGAVSSAAILPVHQQR